MAVPKLVNGGFEEPVLPRPGIRFCPDASQAGDPDHVPGWLTTASDHLIEIWSSGQEGVDADEGGQFAELNANEVSTLYQDLETVPGTLLQWRLSHRGRRGEDTMALDIGPPDATVEQRRFTDDNTAWGHYGGFYSVPAGQTTTRFAFRSISAAGQDKSVGNFLDGIVFGIPDELPPIITEEDVVVPRPDDVSGQWMIIHQVSSDYVITDHQSVTVSQAIQTWYYKPLNTNPVYQGYLWHLEKVDAGEYLIRTERDEFGGKEPLYLEASADTGATNIHYPRIQRRDANERQVWKLLPVGGDPDTYAIESKAFPGYALGSEYGRDLGDTYIIASATWGRPTLQHLWRLSKAPDAQ
jgi:hypothetical protein